MLRRALLCDAISHSWSSAVSCTCAIPFLTVRVVSYEVMLCRVVRSLAVSCYVVSYQVLSPASCPVPWRVLPCRIVFCRVRRAVSCHTHSCPARYAPVSKMSHIDEIQSHHFSAIFALISCPGGVSMGRERQLEVCCIFSWMSLCSNSTHFNCSPKVDLKPFINPVIRSRAPPRVWNVVQPTKSCQVTRAIDRGRCHVIIRDDTGIGHTNRMVTVSYFCVSEWIILVDKIMLWFGSVCRIRMCR